MINFIINIWHQELKSIRKHPVRSFMSIVFLMAMINLGLGYWVSMGSNPNADWAIWVNNSQSILGWLSMNVGWAVALIAWAYKVDPKVDFKGVGKTVEEANRSFDASIILGSLHTQPEWHIRHIQPKHVEFVWTNKVLEKTKALLKQFDYKYQPCFSLDSAMNGLNEEQLIDIQKVKLHCSIMLERILRDYDASRVCMDVTAGNVTMTLGGFLAAEEVGVTTIYLLGNSTSLNGVRIIDPKRIEEHDEATVVIVSDKRQLSDVE